MSIKPFLENPAKTDGFIHENPVLNRIYQNRGMTCPDDIHYSLDKLLPPNTMMGMDKGTDLLIEHIISGSRIIVVGDYDCDGATATAIAVEGLKMLGAKDVDFLVPDRVVHGYGLSVPIVELVGKSKPDLIVTVDNGISSFDGAAAIRQLEKPCQLLITDHHLAPEEGLPDADAIINPNQNGCQFPSKSIAGCGVMFYVIMALRAKMRERGLFEKLGFREPSLAPLLDLLTMGTVADVVPFDLNNRIIVSAGLKRINEGHIRPGMRNILELKGRKIGSIVSMDMGFAAGPCFNAAGRLDDMSVGIRCMLEHNDERALDYAKRLFDLNEQRKEIGAEMEDEALELLENLNIESNRYAVCLHSNDWHEGVVGILASRIKEKLNRPVIIFTDTHDASAARKRIDVAKDTGASEYEIKELEEALMQCDIKGSARSVPDVHLKHILDSINKKRPEVLSKFGGHAMAAGMSLKLAHFEEFQDMLDAAVRKILTKEMIKGKVDVDIKNIDPALINLETAELLREAGPWGQNFIQPLFSQNFIVEGHRVLKEKHLKLQLRPEGSDVIFDAIAFGCVIKGELPMRERIEASFSMDVNEWRGKRSLQLMIHYLQDEELILERQVGLLSADKKEDEISQLGAVAAQKAAIKREKEGLSGKFTLDHQKSPIF